MAGSGSAVPNAEFIRARSLLHTVQLGLTHFSVCRSTSCMKPVARVVAGSARKQGGAGVEEGPDAASEGHCLKQEGARLGSIRSASTLAGKLLGPSEDGALEHDAVTSSPWLFEVFCMPDVQQ